MKKINKQLFMLTTILIMLASYVLPYTSKATASAEGYLTVAEALTTGTGTSVTVKGYIVGYTKGTNSFTFNAPFAGDTNLAIADSPTETDPAKIMPVEVTKNFRTTFGLMTNPTIVGKEIVVTAVTAAYFSMPGLKTPTDIYFSGEGGGGGTPAEPPVVSGTEPLKIGEIQGAAHTSPYAGQTVHGVEGIVTYVVDGSNFYMQSAVPDDNPQTSEAILVNRSSNGTAVGDLVAVDGLVKEVTLDGYSDKGQTDLTTTEIAAATGTVAKKATGQVLPAPFVLDQNSIPSQVIDNDQFTSFDPSEDGIDFYESMEGMRVSLANPTVVGPQKNGEVPVIVGQVPGKTYTDAGGTLLTKDNPNPERLNVVVGDRNYVTKTGDSFAGTITGVVGYSYSSYKILTKTAGLPALKVGTNAREVLTLEKAADKLTIASYNIENFTAADMEKTNKLAESFVTNLKTPDIIGLVEVQDNNGATNNGVVDASANYTGLINAIQAKGGPAYSWTDIAPENNKDGGAAGGNIRVGFLYNPERVTLATGAPKGTATQAVGYENGALTLNPGRIDPTNAAFTSSRKPLAAEFIFNGEKVIVIANHFNSKGGDEAPFGKHQPAFLGSEAQRIEIAKTVNGFIAGVLEKNPEAQVAVLGDLNDFEFSNPLITLKGDILSDLIETVPLAERYSYNHQGNAQVLDHILATKGLATGAETDIVHINSQFMEAQGRVSDHDPVVAQFDFSGEKEPIDETEPEVVPEPGWRLLDGVWYFFEENGVKHTGWLDYYGNKYYLGTDGALQTGMVTIDGINYFFGTDGRMMTGWVKVSQNWYYFGQDGAMQTGFIEFSGKTYYLDANGALQTGWMEIDGDLYFFGPDGRMFTGWVELGEDIYFFDEDGIMVTGLAEIDGDVYFFDEDGALQAGFIEIDGDGYYFDPETGAMVTGWVNEEGKWYYFDGLGVMKTKWLSDGGKWYYLDPTNGDMKTGWVQDKGKWYFMASSGAMQTGWVKSGSKWYFMDTSGAMKTGWAKVNNKWYYLNSGGAMQVGWVNVSGKWYYFYSDGKMAASTTIQGYKLGASGAWIR